MYKNQTKFRKHPPSGALLLHVDGRTDRTKLRVAFGSYCAEAPITVHTEVQGQYFI
jgi:hypothetical protein